ncbi:MAG TPA: DUF4956 domain-containing protein [Aeromicrobium sp.]|nr:DUF4956 domain-containing protein [Aeromicrobium sp.]
MTVSADVVALLGRAGLDLLTLLTLVGWLYKGQQSVPSMPLIFTSLNIGIFAAVTAFTSTPGVLTAGLGFGLFAILQMIRLRSAAFTVKDVAFTFLVLITGLINALPNLDWTLLVALDIVVVLGVAVTDSGRDTKVTRVMQLTLEKAYSDPVEVREMLQERLGLAIESVVIKEIDFVRDTTDLKMAYFVDPAWGSSASEEMTDSPEELYRS